MAIGKLACRRATALMSLAFAGCSQVPLPVGSPTPPPSAAPAPAAAAASPAAPPAPAASGAAAVAGTPPSPPSRQGAAVQAPQQVSAVDIGSRRRQFVSVVDDAGCQRVVAPFDLTGNAADVVKAATGSILDALPSLAERFGIPRMPGQAQTPAGTAAREGHNIRRDTRLALQKANWLPMPAERYYGQQVLKRIRDDGSIVAPQAGRAARRQYDRALALLREVVDAIPEKHDYEFEIHVRAGSTDEPNAQALPGGIVLIDSRFVDDPAMRERALFAVAHEVGHVLQRHETRALQARLIDSASLRGDARQLVDEIGQLKGGSMEKVFAPLLAGKLQFERHSEVQELHSDACAVRLLDAALGREDRVLASVRSFAASLKPSGATASVAGTSGLDNLVELVSRPIDRHPSTQERVQFLDRVIVALYGAPAAATTTQPPSPRDRAASPAAAAPAGPSRRPASR